MKLYQLGMSLVFIIIFTRSLYASEKKIVLIEQAKMITQQEIYKSSQTKSEKNVEGGYNANTNVIDSFAQMEYRYYSGGRYLNKPIRFRLSTPSTIQLNKKYPLIVWFHGSGESGNDNTRQLSHIQSAINYLAGVEKLDVYVLATQCPPDNRVWNNSINKNKIDKGDAPITIADEILTTLVEEFPIDTNRIGIFGLCSGGYAAWEYANKYPGRFAALVTCSADPRKTNVESFMKTAIWTFNNKDDQASYKYTEQFVRMINRNGGNAYATINETGGHDSWTNALSRNQVLGWMILQSLENTGPPQGMICYHRTNGELFILFGIPALLVAGMFVWRLLVRKDI